MPCTCRRDCSRRSRGYQATQAEAQPGVDDAPLSHVAVHVAQAQLVWRIGSHPRSSLQEFPLLHGAERPPAVEVRLSEVRYVGRLVEVEVVGTFFLRSRPVPTGVFPFRLRRQAVHIALRRALFSFSFLMNSCASSQETLSTGNSFSSSSEMSATLCRAAASARKPAGVVAHDRLPLPLRHVMHGDLEVLLDLRLHVPCRDWRSTGSQPM